MKFQLTHLLRGATAAVVSSALASIISTHAPLARCDLNPLFLPPFLCISTHAPLARCDVATGVVRTGREYFNSRTSCEVRRWGLSQQQQQLISTHAPLARCDPSRRPTNAERQISTHAPLARCDFAEAAFVRRLADFNSRTSCEVRLRWCTICPAIFNFNSRTSCEVRHVKTRPRHVGFAISTHAPLARCDLLLAG